MSYPFAGTHISSHTDIYLSSPFPCANHHLHFITLFATQILDFETSRSRDLHPGSCTIRANSHLCDLYLRRVVVSSGRMARISTGPGQCSISRNRGALTVALKRSSKRASGGKEATMAKVLLERVAEGVEWVEKKRQSLLLGPGFTDEVSAWEAEIRLEDSPMFKYVKTQRKLREKRQRLLQKVNFLQLVWYVCTNLYTIGKGWRGWDFGRLGWKLFLVLVHIH